MDKFKNREELEEYMEENSYGVSTDPEACNHCNTILVDSFGCLEFIVLDVDELGNPRFCNEECMQAYLIAKVGLDED
jgi:hypothetical protein